MGAVTATGPPHLSGSFSIFSFNVGNLGHDLNPKALKFINSATCNSTEILEKSHYSWTSFCLREGMNQSYLKNRRKLLLEMNSIVKFFMKLEILFCE